MAAIGSAVYSIKRVVTRTIEPSDHSFMIYISQTALSDGKRNYLKTLHSKAVILQLNNNGLDAGDYIITL